MDLFGISKSPITALIPFSHPFLQFSWFLPVTSLWQRVLAAFIFSGDDFSTFFQLKLPRSFRWCLKGNTTRGEPTGEMADRENPGQPGRKTPPLWVLWLLTGSHILPLGIPSRCCSLAKPLNVAFSAWDIISLLLGVNKGTSAHSMSERSRRDTWP